MLDSIDIGDGVWRQSHEADTASAASHNREKGAGQIDAETHPKKRLIAAQITDFPTLFRIGLSWRKSGSKGIWGRRLFGRNCFPEIA